MRKEHRCRRIFILPAFLFLLYSCATTRQAEKRISFELDNIPGLSHGFSGFALYDPVKDEMLYSHNADRNFTPASNIKLFTLYTGLKILSDSIPAIKYTVSGDSLIFKGTGDPSLLNPNLPGSKVYNFLKNSEHKLFYAPAEFQEKPLGPGWAWDDYNSHYSAERSDLPLYGNLMKIEFDHESGEVLVMPEIFKDSLIRLNSTTSKDKYARRGIASNKIEYYLIERDRDFAQKIPIRFYPELIPRLLSDTLNKPVSIFPGKTGSLIFNKTLYGIATDSIYKRMMQESDNFLAEQILLLSSAEISDSLKSSIAIDHMLATHLKDLPDEPRWVDGSGLSRYNLASPRTMVKLLEKIANEIPMEKIFQIFPAGGKSGTLQNDYLAETPYIYAKTGTLSNNHSLSGFVLTRSGRILIFSLMNSNYTIPTARIKQSMTVILEEVRDHY
ncbi:D-alanyl-D-alanine carboxypeptidase/D-alanyl-D-alanine-endopeptidase [Christiangramia sabulilitoris]|uniref:D-alanyl-D-alanine carboxypeptidase n=1 Tax=Christiangramia sabulilitoris TaxID=2583991 RepID=A0A550I3R9_9FLAO|nr:D-alanyl-D-alanine carboxypeptidase [Christiangramia sabulilitoris]TRO65615.1 D-alanyl-D-alanine carboxypeptidase [Christiangramia sabulilitoris]